MSGPSFQTMRLSRGRHGSPDEGACVMELASMVAGEPFSDHCRRVCPVIGAFLRGYNDGIDPVRRRDLIPYAARVIDTRAGDGPADRRAALCLEFARRAYRSLPWRVPWGPRFPHRRRSTDSEVAGRWMAAAARRDGRWHARTLELLDALIATTSPTGTGPPPAPPSSPGGRSGALPLATAGA